MLHVTGKFFTRRVVVHENTGTGFRRILCIAVRNDSIKRLGCIFCGQRTTAMLALDGLDGLGRSRNTYRKDFPVRPKPRQCSLVQEDKDKGK
jgi:hypothetical protein